MAQTLDLPSLRKHQQVLDILTKNPALARILSTIPSLLQSTLREDEETAKIKAGDTKGLEAPRFDPVNALAMLGGGAGLLSAVGNEGVGAGIQTALEALGAPKAPTKAFDKPMTAGKPTSALDPIPKLPDFDRTPGQYIHGIGPNGTGPIERIPWLKLTRGLHQSDWDEYPKKRQTQKLGPKDRETGFLLENHYAHAKATRPLDSSDPQHIADKLKTLTKDNLPENADNLLFHGLNVWDENKQYLARKLRKISEKGLNGGWFSEEPVEAFGPTFLGVDKANLPPILSQARTNSPEDPPVELVPNWTGGNLAKGIPPDKAGAQALLHKMGAYAAEDEKLDNPINIHPYNIYLMDAAKRIFGRLGKSRPGQKATTVLSDLAELLKHE